MSTGSYVPPYKLEQPLGKALIILGAFVTLLSMWLLWRNERKTVSFEQLIHDSRSACKVVDPWKPVDDYDFDLVHITGRTENKIDLCDRDF